MANLLWTYEDEESNTSNVISCPAELSNFLYKLLMLTKIIKLNYMVKKDVEHFHFISFQFTVLLKLFIHIHLSIVFETELAEFFEFLVLAGGDLFL